MVKELLRVPCKPEGNNDPLLKDSINVTAAAGVETTIPLFTVPTGRGAIKAIQVFVTSAAIADAEGGLVTLNANGTSVLDEESVVPYSSMFGNTNIPMRINIPEAATLNGKVFNASGNAWDIIIDLYYFNPFEQ